MGQLLFRMTYPTCTFVEVAARFVFILDLLSKRNRTIGVSIVLSPCDVNVVDLSVGRSRIGEPITKRVL